ncbi:MAG: lipoyl(octanoyl) transferase LipB [Candidimonas sp.]|nr:MAG: lipoyl(octanoyl) transferase LipB [Candidimonas sp.]
MIDVRWLPRPAPYLTVWQAMRDMTDARDARTPDAIWLVEHEPVYTLGQAGDPRHVLHADGIPVVHCDRGGQVTYHGPGQVVAYCLIDLRRLGVYVKDYVVLLEEAAIAALAELGVANACVKPRAPGVYVPMPGGALGKIAALGIKIHNGRGYHGLALNVAMDLTPFLGINPCGYEGLRTVDLATCGVAVPLVTAGDVLARHLVSRLAGPDVRI